MASASASHRKSRPSCRMPMFRESSIGTRFGSTSPTCGSRARERSFAGSRSCRRLRIFCARWTVASRRFTATGTCIWLPNHELREADWIGSLDHALREAVRLHLVSDVPVGAFLSGGLDSSTVVAYMAQASAGRVKTFSIGFDEADFDELTYARQVASRYGTDHFEMVVKPDVMSVLPRLSLAVRRAVRGRLRGAHVLRVEDHAGSRHGGSVRRRGRREASPATGATQRR